MSGLFLRVLLLCIAWIVTDGTSTTEVIGHTGGSVHISCEYSKRYINYTKYFCKGVPPGCVDKIRTSAVQKLVTQSTYSLFDNGRDSFQVNISHLDFEDEGLYQCAVDIPRARDVYEEIYVDVTDEGETKASPPPTVQMTSALADYRTNSTAVHPAVTRGKLNGHAPRFAAVLTAIVVSFVALLVAVVILGITLYAKRTKSSDSVNLPPAMETQSVAP